MQVSVSFGITQNWCVILFSSASKLREISYIPLIPISSPHILFNFSSLLSILSFLVSKGNLENKNSEIALTEAPVSTKACVATSPILIAT